MITPNTQYRAISTGEEFVLKRIIERRGQTKLSTPIYVFSYTNRNYDDFTCYLEHVERALHFGSWVKI